MFYLCLVLLLILTIFHIVTRYSKRGRLLRKIPGLPAYPIVGNIAQFYTSSLHEIWVKVLALVNNYYPVTRFWACSTAVVVVRHPHDLQILLSQKEVVKGYIYDYLRPWLRNGLLISTGDLWHQRRKLLIPAFHINILKMYADIANEESRQTILELKAKGKSSIECLADFCSKYTLNVICESAMGVKFRNMDIKIFDEYLESVDNMSDVMIYRIIRPYIQTWMMPFIYKWGNIQKRALKCLQSFSKKIIEERIAYHKRNDYKLFTEHAENSKDLLDDEDKISSKKRLSMLDILLAAEQNNQIDFKGIQDEVNTFTFGGYDTTGMSLLFTLWLLAEHKEEQEKCRVEARDLINKSNRNLLLSNLKESSYIERCIKESLRLYPPVTFMQRYISKDLQLKHVLIPANTHVAIHLYATHRDPNFWPEPDKFLPDRFLPENCINRHPFAYLPFSAGPRNCIGQKFAMMEMKILIAQILCDFYLEPIDRIADVKITVGSVIKPLNPVRIKFISIKNNTT